MSLPSFYYQPSNETNCSFMGAGVANSSSNGSSSYLPSPISPAAQRPPNPIDVVRVEQAQDGGAVEQVEWVPPQYNPAWDQGRTPTPLHIPGAEPTPTAEGYSAAQMNARNQLLSPLTQTHPSPATPLDGQGIRYAGQDSSKKE